MKKKGKKRSDLILLLIGMILILAGGLVYLLPSITNQIYESNVKQELQSFEKNHIQGNTQIGETGSIPEETQDPRLQELYERLDQANKELFDSKQNRLVDPFSYEQNAVDLSEYGLKDNIIGYITIEKINVVLPILLGASVENMRVGAVHLTETSYPIGGNNTNCVLAAHRGASTQEMFRNIHMLEPGDEIIIDNFRERLVYRMVNHIIIDPAEIGKVLIQEDRDLVTLISCNPLGQNIERYVVFCERVTE